MMFTCTPGVLSEAGNGFGGVGASVSLCMSVCLFVQTFKIY